MHLVRSLAVAALGVALSFSAASAQETTKIRFTLDWKLQGIHTWFFWAKEKGYFAQEKLDVQIDQGEGSAGAVTRVMSGAYDAAFGDANAVIQNAATKPDDAPLIGETGGAGVFAALGHYRNGVLFAPATAEIIADQVLDGKVSPLAKAFGARRFAEVRFDKQVEARHSRSAQGPARKR